MFYKSISKKLILVYDSLPNKKSEICHGKSLLYPWYSRKTKNNIPIALQKTKVLDNVKNFKSRQKNRLNN